VTELNGLISGALDYSFAHLEDAPEIRDWTWPAG
jgi:hypothetical protein